MTDSMIERVARVLEPQAWAALGIGDTFVYKNRRTSSLRKARAAIAALREPTEEMYEAGGTSEAFQIQSSIDPSRLWQPGQIIAATVWRTMIDAALSEP